MIRSDYISFYLAPLRLHRQASERLPTKPTVIRRYSTIQRQRTGIDGRASYYRNEIARKQRFDTLAQFDQQQSQRTNSTDLDTLLRLRRAQNVYEMSKIGMDTLFNLKIQDKNYRAGKILTDAINSQLCYSKYIASAASCQY